MPSDWKGLQNLIFGILSANKEQIACSSVSHDKLFLVCLLIRKLITDLVMVIFLQR